MAVDRHPGKVERSNELYRWQPLTWEELQLRAHIGDDPMAWQVKHDRDAFKEIWLLFENEHGKFARAILGLMRARWRLVRTASCGGGARAGTRGRRASRTA